MNTHKQLHLGVEFSDKLRNILEDKLGDQLTRQLYRQLDIRLGNRLRDQIYVQINNQLYDKVWPLNRTSYIIYRKVKNRRELSGQTV